MDWARLKRKSKKKYNRTWHYNEEKEEFKISREDLAKQVKEFKKGKK